jgi:hypothetical protein
MADNNHDPQEVGGLQPIYCPQCNLEVKTLDSYQLSTANKRYHYPECWQRHELGLAATGTPVVKVAPVVEKHAPPGPMRFGQIDSPAKKK